MGTATTVGTYEMFGVQCDTEHLREEWIWLGSSPGLRQRLVWRWCGCAPTVIFSEGAHWNMPFGAAEEAVHREVPHGGTHLQNGLRRFGDAVWGWDQASDTHWETTWGSRGDAVAMQGSARGRAPRKQRQGEQASRPASQQEETQQHSARISEQLMKLRLKAQMWYRHWKRFQLAVSSLYSN